MDTIHKTYLALGDSYTIGESVADTERFPVLTVKLLREQNIDISNPAIIAVTGWTTTNLLNALDNNPPPKKNVFLCIASYRSEQSIPGKIFG